MNSKDSSKMAEVPDVERLCFEWFTRTFLRNARYRTYILAVSDGTLRVIPQYDYSVFVNLMGMKYTPAQSVVNMAVN